MGADTAAWIAVSATRSCRALSLAALPFSILLLLLDDDEDRMEVALPVSAVVFPAKKISRAAALKTASTWGGICKTKKMRQWSRFHGRGSGVCMGYRWRPLKLFANTVQTAFTHMIRLEMIIRILHDSSYAK